MLSLQVGLAEQILFALATGFTKLSILALLYRVAACSRGRTKHVVFVLSGVVTLDTIVFVLVTIFQCSDPYPTSGQSLLGHIAASTKGFTLLLPVLSTPSWTSSSSSSPSRWCWVFSCLSPNVSRFFYSLQVDCSSASLAQSGPISPGLWSPVRMGILLGVCTTPGFQAQSSFFLVSFAPRPQPPNHSSHATFHDSGYWRNRLLLILTANLIDLLIKRTRASSRGTYLPMTRTNFSLT
ncbi:uncharacterized protein PODANS_7_6060 [Podospora anserina S mat+]|uniref:Podospora anserina S mat+ genomic DNA chromosome 7, supercontig 1 n=1 Tax=Podospora anserina (strain S / ATCC MYA-4624 / DSM 980 / FGSC 10383) TaxID=515849 RepID=B2AW61_PODAN|nr:uncharacterized protein PODANS_7_6060 [Podospora anserina S mat+]CAP68635.1 unnamed protein product [Podospora anserina S mat+]CDP32108.1 Putative protein of unknown function [Podospora anserina S mat+]